MSKDIANPTRLSGLPENEDPQHLGRLFRSALELPDEELPRLQWRLRMSLRRRSMLPSRVLRQALIVGLVFCMGGVVGAVVVPGWQKRWHRTTPESSVPRTATPPPATKKRRASHAGPAQALSPVDTEALPDEGPQEGPPLAPEATSGAISEPAPAISSEAGPAHGAKSVSAAPAHEQRPPGPRPAAFQKALAEKAPAEGGVAEVLAPAPEPEPPPAAAPPAEAAPSPPSPIAVEQAILGRALKALRAGHDPDAALALLDEHARRFPGAALAAEASVLRIEALLRLERAADALSLLDRLPLTTSPHPEEELVLRGELRAAAGRWREASADFDGSLRGPFPAASAKGRGLQERALWGRSAARSRLGDATGARGDLSLYLRTFPAGRFATEAAALLAGSP